MKEEHEDAFVNALEFYYGGTSDADKTRAAKFFYEQAVKDACETLFGMLPILVSYYDEDIHEHADRSEFIKAFRERMGVIE